MVEQLRLANGDYTIVDAEDYEWLNQWEWRCSNYGYAVRNQNINRKRIGIFMHREINKTPIGMCTDHINGNKLDNRKCNLRTCTNGENQRNSHKRQNTSSIYKGVSWHPMSKKWQASIRKNNKQIHLGVHDTAIDAALVYNQAAIKYFGEFARLNQIGGGE